MKRALGVRVRGPTEARAAIQFEADGLDRVLTLDAELSVTEIATEARVLGAFQRGVGVASGAPLVRRVSGGALLLANAGMLHVALAMTSPSALVSCDPTKILNRYVRPLLRALTKCGAPASYFGRDWISVAHRPAASVGFAHEARTGRTVFEAFVALREPFSDPRSSFLGKSPGSLEAICGRTIDPAFLSGAIVDAYLAAGDRARTDLSPSELTAPLADAEEFLADPPWVSCAEEAIGRVCAGPDRRGALRLGGDLLASRDAVARLEVEVAVLGPAPERDAVGRVVREAFAAPGVALEGVRDVGTLRDVLVEALKVRG
jgi:hypothetical protein